MFGLPGYRNPPCAGFFLWTPVAHLCIMGRPIKYLGVVVKIAVLICICFTMFGCATNFAEVTSAEVSKAIEVKDSTFDTDITYTGPPAFSETRRGLFVDNQTTRLAAVKNKKSRVVTYAVYVQIMYSFDWRFYNSVSLIDGTQLKANSLSQRVNACTAGAGCIHTEELVFVVELDRLKAKGDLVFRVNSKTGVENIITVPNSYITGFLNGLPKN